MKSTVGLAETFVIASQTQHKRSFLWHFPKHNPPSSGVIKCNNLAYKAVIH